jgi:hypothetical protein
MLKSAMHMNDGPVMAVLKCAKCNRPVQSGKAHICGFMDKFSASGGVEMYLKAKEPKNENPEK